MSMVPRGKVTGKLWVQGREIPVSGEGYHEQGRANISMMRIFTRWDWLKFYAGEYTIVMPIGVSTKKSFNTQVRGALVYKGKELLADVFESWPLRKVRVNILEEKTDTETGRKYPVLIGISIRSSEVQIEAKLAADRRLERFKFTDFKGRESQPQVWFQHLAGLEGRANVRGKEEALNGRGIIETMLLGSV
jgi:predicted secreted hydrolase